MRFSKKGALFDELPLFIVSLVIVFILMVGLHFIVVFQGDSAQSKAFEESRFLIDGSFYLNDFIETPLSSDLLETHGSNLGIDFEDSSKNSLKFALRSSQKDIAQEVFVSLRDDYLKENEEALESYIDFYETDITNENLLYYGYFELSELGVDSYASRSYRANCVFDSPNFIVLPIRSGAILEEIVVVSFLPFSQGCIDRAQGGVLK